MVKAAQMAVDEVNAAGGLLGGRKVELVIQDDATDNAIAVNVANIFAGNDKISAVVGPWNSGMILAAESVYKDAKIPFFGLGTNPQLLELDNEYCFLTRANSALGLQIEDLTGDVGVADVDGFGIDSHAGVLAGGFDDFHSAGAELVVRIASRIGSRAGTP